MIAIEKVEGSIRTVKKIPSGSLDQFMNAGWNKIGDMDDEGVNFVLGTTYGAFAQKQDDEKPERPKKLSAMSISELKSKLDEYDIEYNENMTKEELKRLLYDYRKQMKENE